MIYGGEFFDGIVSIQSDQLYQYSLKNNQWSLHMYKTNDNTSNVPPPRCAHASVLYQEYLYIFGGEFATTESYVHYRDVWKYHIPSQAWTPIIPKATSTNTNANNKAPSARSGPVSVLYHHYWILFGGFYESKEAPRWFNDVCVMDLQTETWLDIPYSKLSAKPEPRSACNAAVIGDSLLVHGGFSKLKLKGSNYTPGTSGGYSSARNRLGGAQHDATLGDDEDTAGPREETRVHTDTWCLNLKPILQGKPPTWERWTSTVPRNQLLQCYFGSNQSSTNSKSAKSSLSPKELFALRKKLGPNGRSGTSSVAYKDKLLVFGGVCDQEFYHHKVTSVFFNDLYAFDVERKNWFLIQVKHKESKGDPASAAQQHETTDPQTAKEDEDDASLASDASDLHEDEEEENGENEPSNMDSAWDIEKLRSNMFAFLDGDGNVVYERMDERESGKAAVALNLPAAVAEEKEDDTESDSDEEMKQDDTVDMPTSGRSTRVHDKPRAMSDPPTACGVKSSSVMSLNPETRTPEAVARSEPLPRIKASMVVSGHTLYLYGGLLEVGDREITLDDLWSLDLKKRNKWECIFPGTMHKQVWRGAVHDDDDSYVSDPSSTTGTNNVAGDESSDDEGSNDNSGDKQADSSDSFEHQREYSEMAAKYGLDDTDRTPQSGESLSDFYARTATYWNEEAVSMLSKRGEQVASAKELKREAFALARKRFEDLEPVLERLANL